VEDVFAVGDCAGFLEQTGKPVLPALAQVRLFFTCCKFSILRVCPLCSLELHISLKNFPLKNPFCKSRGKGKNWLLLIMACY
jgi:hypothetical protein